METSLIIKATDQASGALKGVESAVGSLGAALGAAGLLKILSDAGKEFADSDRNAIILQKEIENLGSEMGVTKKSVEEMNTQMTKSGLYYIDSAEAADKLLLGFQKLKGQIPAITELLPDLAAKMGTDLPEAAGVLAKAMEKPANAARLLKAAHLSLSIEQEQAIKNMMKVGDIAGAQAVIMDTVKNATNGMADAIRNSPYGQNEALKNSITGINESLGKTVDELTGPFKEAWISAMNVLLKLQDPGATIIKGLVIGIAGITAAVLLFNAVSAMNPMVAIISRIVVGIGALITAIFMIKNNWELISGVATKVFLNMGKIIGDFAYSARIIIMEFVQKVIQGIEFIYSPVINVFNKIIEGINSVLKTHIPTITGLLDSVSKGIQKNIEQTKKDKEEMDKSYKAQITAIDLKIKALQKEGKSTEKLEKDKQKLIKDTAEIEKAAAKTSEELMNEKLQIASTITSSMTGLTNQLFANELEGAKGNNEKTKEIKRNQFTANKLIGIANTTISTIEAVMKAMSLDPTGILAIIVGTMGAIQTGLIAAAPMPAFAKGGVSSGGFALVGEQGPEIVNLPAGAVVHSNQNSKNMMGQTFYFNAPINVTANNPTEFYNALLKQKKFELARV